MPRPTTVTINTDALRHNLGVVRAHVGHRQVMAVVKADGYGHGLECVARALREADAFAVAGLSEAKRIRALGLTQPVLLLSGFDAPEDLAQLQSLGIQSVIHHHHQIDMLEQQASSGMPPPRCWLKIDSGMHRLGFAPDQTRVAHARLVALGSEPVLMTHFASSDEPDNPQTQRQLEIFERATEGLPGPRSLANSAAILGWPQTHGDWVRAGGALYGISLVAGKSGPDFDLRPAMTLSTRLLAVNPLLRGLRIGYAATWETPQDMPVGVAAIGYGDGYPRAAASGTPALVNGRAAGVIGRVSMDLTLLDLRQHPNAVAGDPVVLWGQGLPIEQVAACAGTIGYDLACSITARVMRKEQGAGVEPLAQSRE